MFVVKVGIETNQVNGSDIFRVQERGRGIFFLRNLQVFLGKLQNIIAVAEIHRAGRAHLDAGRQQSVFHPVAAHITLGDGAVFSFTRNIIGTGFADFRGVQPARVLAV